jgi:hypothetical protein
MKVPLKRGRRELPLRVAPIVTPPRHKGLSVLAAACHRNNLHLSNRHRNSVLSVVGSVPQMMTAFLNSVVCFVV